MLGRPSFSIDIPRDISVFVPFMTRSFVLGPEWLFSKYCCGFAAGAPVGLSGVHTAPAPSSTPPVTSASCSGERLVLDPCGARDETYTVRVPADLSHAVQLLPVYI